MMHYMKLGKTGILIPALTLGTWAMGGGDSWGDSDDRLCEKTIEKSLELGINYLDTAPAYGNGKSEEIVGRVIKRKREKFVLATKCGLVWGNHDEGSVHKSRDGVTIRRNLSEKSIRVQVEQSLSRLQTDYIDVLLTHWPAMEPFDTPIEETVFAFEQLKREGKIRCYGACNVNQREIEEYQKYGSPSIIQKRFSLLNRENEDLALYCNQNDITFQAYSPLERGLLTGNVKQESNVVGTAKESIPWFKIEKRMQVLAMLEELKDMCTAYQCTVGNLVLAWTMAYIPRMNVLCGARKPEQVLENSLCGSITLKEEDIRCIDSLARKLL
ncbi:putative oxidoreductase, aryl-alcohol dehydrogenase like protein [Sphaerochaeta pleomorpha str. Grapes]|uniref:Putative oxidoreductase, aryl-alcohol dehydrogenase like protein n=1 Tax=Sphaerochaeta pleomorpha (strain ATCC BAA-1885 / DSM 22778 / Grapes) TaxID=158190 RepID=G8QQF5_SPHPG|nr:aldo/keto reductase [Sphaerochaeta pleomorpha]AEV29800.1 putative oxidoreductase, aryl-alcohol dehydrogenase like protein [Sphaerochaeta pleomorpha str. Grapes]